MHRPLTLRPVALALVVVAATLASPAARAADPTTAECVRLNEGAGPLQKAGKLVEAHASLVRCSAATCPAIVRDDCAKGALEVASAIPSIVFETHDAKGGDLSKVVLRVDGQERSDRLTGVALEMDPGEHVFRFEADGYVPLERKFVIHAGEKNRREQIALTSVAAAAAPPPPPVAPPTPASRPLRTAGFVVGGVGVAGLAVGGALGWLAHTSWSRAVSECGGGCPEGAPARGLASTAHTDATISNVAFAAGGALVLSGVILALVPASPASEKAASLRVAPMVGPKVAGLAAAWVIP